MVDIKGKLYPVKFAQFKDTKSTGSSGKSKGKFGENGGKASEKSVKKRPMEVEEEETGKLRDQTNVPEILSKAKVRFSVFHKCPYVHVFVYYLVIFAESAHCKATTKKAKNTHHGPREYLSLGKYLSLG